MREFQILLNGSDALLDEGRTEQEIDAKVAELEQLETQFTPCPTYDQDVEAPERVPGLCARCTFIDPPKRTRSGKCY